MTGRGSPAGTSDANTLPVGLDESVRRWHPLPEEPYFPQCLAPIVCEHQPAGFPSDHQLLAGVDEEDPGR